MRFGLGLARPNHKLKGRYSLFMVFELFFTNRFLDDYYSKYGTRVSQSQVGRTGLDSTERMDTYDGYGSDEMYEETPREMPIDYATLQKMQMQAMLKKQEQLQMALQQKVSHMKVLTARGRL